jgi:hypothetical protein
MSSSKRSCVACSSSGAVAAGAIDEFCWIEASRLAADNKPGVLAVGVEDMVS